MIGTELLLITLIIAALSFAVGVFADRGCNRSALGWGVASFIFSPFLVFIILVITHLIHPIDGQYEDD